MISERADERPRLGLWLRKIGVICMSIMKNILDFLYAEKNIDIRDSINIELDECQSILEKNGFKVKRSKHLVNYEAAQCLTAEKGSVILIANRFLRGGKDLSMILNHCGQATRVPLFPSKLNEVIVIVNAAQCI